VLAIDIDTRFVEPLAGDTIEVRQLETSGPTSYRSANWTWCTPGCCSIINSRSPGFDVFRLSFESLRAAVVNAGLLSREDADAAADRFAKDLRVQTTLTMAGIGRC
jgi:hypothetical protein